MSARAPLTTQEATGMPVLTCVNQVETFFFFLFLLKGLGGGTAMKLLAADTHTVARQGNADTHGDYIPSLATHERGCTTPNSLSPTFPHRACCRRKTKSSVRLSYLRCCSMLSVLMLLIRRSLMDGSASRSNFSTS